MKRKKTARRQTSCDSCANYVYDEEYECYTCEVDLDEDEMARFMADTFYDCPYYRLGDEYAIARKQEAVYLQILYFSAACTGNAQA